MGKCPCGSRNSPDPSCDMCDSFAHDPDTGWGGYTNHFTGRHHSSEESETQNSFWGDDDDDDTEGW